jgi:hypothetical protein
VGLLALVSWSAQAAQGIPGWRADIAASFADFKGDDTINPSVGDKFIDDSSVGLKISGQYRFNSWFGLEGAYHNTGEFEDLSTDSNNPGNLELSFDGFSLQGLFYLPSPSAEIQPYLKAGMYDFDDELSFNGNVTSNSSESGFAGGAGAIIEINEQFGIRADLDWFDAEVGDLWSVNLGLHYAFGGTKVPASVDETAQPSDTDPATATDAESTSVESPASASEGETDNE